MSQQNGKLDCPIVHFVGSDQSVVAAIREVLNYSRCQLNVMEPSAITGDSPELLAADVILVDFDRSNYEWFANLRFLPTDPRPLLVALLNDHDDEQRAICEQLRFDVLLTKPLNSDVLNLVLQAASDLHVPDKSNQGTESLQEGTGYIGTRPLD